LCKEKAAGTVLKRFTGFDWAALALTLVVGAAGGLGAQALGLPLALLMGSLVVTGIIAAAGWRPLGRAILLPTRLRASFIPVIGVSIGGAFTPAVLAEAPRWGASLLALLVFIPATHALAYFIYRRGGLPRTAAFFGSVPGGLIETIQLGEEAGADPRLLTVLQFLRLILTIIAVPLMFWLVTGSAVGSASGVTMAASAVPLSLREVVVLLLAGGLGFLVARALRFPAAIMTGPVLFSALAHAFGLVHGVPPGWLVGVTQVVVGCGLGARFAGVDHGMMRRAALLAGINAVAALVLAFGFALALHALVGEPIAAVFLAFAPGGLAEMSLIALSLNMSVAYVTVHHVARIVLSVTVAKIGARWV
jgi:membrane AbrB-like protein